MENSATVLFELVDQKLQSTAKDIRNRVFSAHRDMPWTPQQREVLLPLIERELDLLIQRILGVFDNVGSQLPEGVSGWSIIDKRDQADIRVPHVNGASADYADMWLGYLNSKGRLDRLLEK